MSVGSIMSSPEGSSYCRGPSHFCSSTVSVRRSSRIQISRRSMQACTGHADAQFDRRMRTFLVHFLSSSSLK